MVTYYANQRYAKGGSKMKQAKFLSGFLLGTVLFGSSSALASGIWAEKSSQNIRADGKKINIEAYNINGNNYVKLRDIAQAADFKVWYDAEKGTVEIDSDEPYSQDKTKLLQLFPKQAK